MRRPWIITISGLVIIVLALLTYSCSRQPGQLTEYRHFPINETTELIAERLAVLDRAVSADGDGSWRISATEPVTVPLFHLRDIDVEDARLIYRAQVRTEDVQGKVYLEMLCYFPRYGEFFSRDLQSPVTGTTDWSTEETPFFFEKGQNPEQVKLNLVFTGPGTAWIDDIHLLTGPLK